MFDKQAKTTTSNGAFYPKKPQFRVVKSGGFSYVLHIRCPIQIYLELHKNYVEYF
jgi:hypothetical protein